MRHRRVYVIAGSTLAVQFGDLLSSQAEVIVGSDDHLLSMGGGVSGAIAAAAGSMLAVDASKAVPCELGDVVVTTAGALSARYVFHVITIGPRVSERLDEGVLEPEFWTGTTERSSTARDDGAAETPDVIQVATERCLALLHPLGLRSIAFPALGGGAAGIPLKDIAMTMLRSIAGALRNAPEPVQVELYLQPKRWQSDDDYIVFFEQLAQLMPRPDDSERSPTAEVDPTVRGHAWLDESRDRLLRLERDRSHLEQELTSARAESDTPYGESVKSRYIEATRELVSAISERSPVRVFISYSHQDSELAERLFQHMAALRIEGLATWTDRQIQPGANWEEEIHSAIDEADIVLALLSPSFLSSDYCTGTEWNRARLLESNGSLSIVPIVLRPSMWQPLVGDLQALPADGLPVVSHKDPDEAFLEVVVQLRSTMLAIREKRAAGTRP